MRIAIAWFAREDWAELRRLCVDADRLHERYDDWLREAERLRPLASRRRAVAQEIGSFSKA